MFASLRAGRATFWYLAADRLVGAVIARTADEPLLEACAASYARGGRSSLFAPGIVELAWLLGADRVPHVAALAATFCNIDAEPREQSPGSAESGAALVADDFGGVACATTVAAAAATAATARERVVTVRGMTRERSGAGTGAGAPKVRAQLHAVSQAQALFRRARLRLIALDCEACAVATLAQALGTSLPPAATAGASSHQPLAAVSVSPEAEKAAHGLGEDLAVPVGLALAWFGARRAL